ncbi:MAG: RlpA-like protein precursor [Parcubacteria group bacterium ADurb.Bin316]|nr:MAG: RlpA-like protein precursor [Parcubacteria group bacterium ADurb.Bin316]HOZ55986.1 septal ring lytic transglycosylase RlpA family protein [bacterium]
MKKAYIQQIVILAIFSLILLFSTDNKIGQNNAQEEIVKAALAEENIDNDGFDADGWKTYIVKSGDSLAKIARPNLVSVYQLREWNGLNEYSVLRPGMEIKIKKIEYEAYEGMASWYGPGFHGRPMANGDIFNQNEIVVAHRTFPLGLKVKITNLENGKSIVAPVLDRGPYVKNSKGQYTREIDLSSAVADALDTKHKGVVKVKIEPINI